MVKIITFLGNDFVTISDYKKLEELVSRLPFNALTELLESMPTEQTLWMTAIITLNEMKATIETNGENKND